MVELYTDGSFYIDEKSKNKVCAGVGVVIRISDKQYPDEFDIEEYYSFRYTVSELEDKLMDDVGLFTCFNEISSTLIECIGLCEGIKLINNFIENSDVISIYVDDIFLSKMVNEYIQITLNKCDITISENYGRILCMLHNLFMGDEVFLSKILIQHVHSHRDNKYNNMADYLASYKINPKERIVDLLVRQCYFENKCDKKQYYFLLKQCYNGLY